MAISMVGAADRVGLHLRRTGPPGQPQIGLQNAIVDRASAATRSPGSSRASFHLNSFLLMVMLLWMQVGFSMVLLSAAVKGVPVETLEAARIDGANERQIFFQVVVPQIKGTIITVFITVLIGVMKIFDIVYVMTNGNFNTNVVGNEFYNQLCTFFNNGAAAAIVVMLMIAIIPIMIYQVRHFRAEEAARMTDHRSPRPRSPTPTAEDAARRRPASTPTRPRRAGSPSWSWCSCARSGWSR